MLTNKILVTGGAGFIGSHTTVQLINEGFHPVIIDDLRNSQIEIIHRLRKMCNTDIPFYQMDCCSEKSLQEIFEKENIGGVIHFAALKAVGDSVKDPLNYYENNLSSLITLLKVMEANEVHELVFSSSCTVYGIPDSIPVTEAAQLKPAESPYGTTKLMCEQILRDASNANPELKVLALRYFNPIGAHPNGQIGELPNGIPSNLIPFMTQTAAGIRKELTVFGADYDTADGSCIRDYIHVLDLAQAHVNGILWMRENEATFEVFNIGTGNGASVLEVLNNFEQTTGVKVNYKIGPRRDGDVMAIYANAEKAEKVLGWRAKYTLNEALQHAWNWQKSLI